MARVAAVDVGSNSVRLLVADSDGQALTHVERLMRITRLGTGVDEHGRLDDEALGRTLDVLGDFAERWRALGAECVRITATSAVRDAADRDRFFAGAHARTGVDARVLSGADEARTAFRGAVSAVDGVPPYLVLDIGGGSTELILGSTEPVAETSRQLGCVRLTERALPGDPPGEQELAAARALVAAELDAAAAEVDAAAARTLVGVAGTVTTLAALHLGLDDYLPDRIHGTRVPLDGVRTLTSLLASMPASERARLGPMQPGREDVILGGALILEAVMERFGFGEVLTSEADILDGIALDLLAEAEHR
jgi:exopolyphosphatase / guanosine-5'-triphosphate,3'-diphosphate pyrophosphatase